MVFNPGGTRSSTSNTPTQPSVVPVSSGAPSAADFLKDAGSSGLTINTGIPVMQMGYQTGSGTYQFKTFQYDPVESLTDLPTKMWAEGDVLGYKALMDTVKKAGFTSWSQAIQAASMDPQKNSRSWQDYLTWRATDPSFQSQLKMFQNASGSGGSSSSTSTSVSLSSKSQAGAILDQSYQGELGRTASDQEIAGFQKALNDEQRKNPTVTTSHTSSGRGYSSSTSTSKGGFDYTRFARQYAQSQPEFGDRYGAITFMKILDSAINDPNSIDALVKGQ